MVLRSLATWLVLMACTASGALAQSVPPLPGLPGELGVPAPPPSGPQRPPPEQQSPPPAPPRQGGSVGAGEVGAYRGNAARTGATPDDAVFGPLQALWTKELPGYVNSPLLVGGKVIANVGLSAGSGYGSSVIAWDAITGRELWKAPTPGVYFSAHIASDGQRVFSLNHDGVLRAFSITDGRPLWERQLDEDRDRADAPPIVAGGLVLAPVHGSTSGDDLIVASDPATGGEAWRSSAGATYGGVLFADAERVYQVGSCGEATALRLGDGRPAWSVSRQEDRCREGTLVGAVDRGRVYGYGGDVRDARSGEALPPVVLPSGAALDGDLGVGRPGGVQAVDPLTGAARWQRDLPGKAFDIDPLTPLVVGPTVYTVDGDRRLVGLDRRNGEVLSRTAELPEKSASSVGGIIGGMAAGQGVLAVTQKLTLTVFTGVLKPAESGTDIASSAFDVVYGQKAELVAGVGPRLAGRRVSLQADPFPYGRFKEVLSGKQEADRTFYATVRPDRNTRYRLATPGADHRPVLTVSTAPKVSSRVRRTGRDGNTVVMTATVRGPRGLPLRNRRLVAYLGRTRRDRAERLGTAPLRQTAAGRGVGQLRFRAPRFVSAKDTLLLCVPGLAARGFGRADRLERRCGARRIAIELSP